MARIIAGAAIKNVSVYWVALGKLTAQLGLRAGGNDLVGTAFSEKIFGATDRKDKTYTSELDQIILSAGKIPVQRDTFYNIIRYA